MITLTVNGVRQQVESSWPGESLLSVLRESLGLVAAKPGCEQGECGSCSVLVDGAVVCACLVLAAALPPDAEIVTLEGLQSDPRTHDIQTALVTSGGVQCGFCTPGLVVAIHDILSRTSHPSPTEVGEALAGNLCRCTGYGRILAAVESL